MGLFNIAAPLPLANLIVDTFMISDPIGKGIVLLLFCASAVAWSIMIVKHIELKRVEKADRKFVREFIHHANPLTIHVQNPNGHADSPMARIYAHKQQRSITQIDLSQEKLTALQIDGIRKVSECAAADQIVLLENQMTWLGLVYTVAPLLGLFGTVWGVMVAFHGMGQQGMANLSTVAPGVSSALLTTVVGLLVAIPSAIGASKLNEKIRFLSIQMENFCETFAAKLQQSFVYE